MNEGQEIYCRGASMAYSDVAKRMRLTISKAPVEIREYISAVLLPLADSCDQLAIDVFTEASDFLNGKRH